MGALVSSAMTPIAAMTDRQILEACLVLARAHDERACQGSSEPKAQTFHTCHMVLSAHRSVCGVCGTPGAKFFCVPCGVRMCDPARSQCVTKHIGPNCEGKKVSSPVAPEMLAEVPE